MKIHALGDERPDPALAQALAQFERGFSYPLGTSARFSISHGDDPARFYRAMGNGAVFVAEREGKMLGTVGAAIRQLHAADGSRLDALYVGGLKVLPGSGAGFALTRLTAALQTWAQPQVLAAYSVVMDGTARTPERYTGRFGIPAFTEAGRIMLLRLDCENDRRAMLPDDLLHCTDAQGMASFLALARGACAAAGRNPAERSDMTPRWLLHAAGMACGMLEDTRKAKRLFRTDGEELRSAHLSHFAYADPIDGAQLLAGACALAAAAGFPAIFCAVPLSEAQPLIDALGDRRPTLATATVYATGMADDGPWRINTAEI